jgi:hypothetical protein
MISRLVYFLTLNMEVTCSSETSVDFQLTTRRYISEYRTLHNNSWENLKSYTFFSFTDSVIVVFEFRADIRMVYWKTMYIQSFYNFARVIMRPLNGLKLDSPDINHSIILFSAYSLNILYGPFNTIYLEYWSDLCRKFLKNIS